MKTVAVMQPYFFPYAGYYRLLAAADVFVIFDCVQFPRRGWVHRNRLPTATGELDWLTLPLRKAPYDALIRDLTFVDAADSEFSNRCRMFPALNLAPERRDDPLLNALGDFNGSVVDYLERTLRATARRLGYAPEFHRSSALAINPAVKGRDRVMAIVDAHAATRYVNLSGGVDYYDPAEFQARGVRLDVFAPHDGATVSMLARILSEPLENIRSEIGSNLRFVTSGP